MQDGLIIRLLGEAELAAAGRTLALPPSKKTRALLGYLALTGRAHRRDKLCGLFWDVADDPRAALRWSLTKLRELVDQAGRTRLIADREQVRLDLSDVRVDALEVRRALVGDLAELSTSTLEQALGWFRGELLEGLELPDFHAYHVWCLAEREQLRRLQTGVLSTLLARAGAQPERALPLARQLVDLDPLDTRARALFMELLHASGRAREAEAEARTNQRLLGAPALERASAELPQRESQLGSPRHPERALPLVGRARELRALSASLHDPGAFRACLLEAEAGVGKTRLLASATERLPALALLESAAHELTPGSPYGPWLALLRSAPAARLDDELQTALDALTERGAEQARSAREQLFRSVAAFLGRASQRHGRLTLVLDDSHWLDEGSAELLLDVSQRCAALPITVLLAARPGALADNPDVLRVLRALRHQGLLLELALAPFSPEETRALLGSISSSADPDAVHRDSAGNPLFALELARAASSAAELRTSSSSELVPRAPDVPLSITRLVRDRTSTLSTEVTDVLRWAAVLGSSFDPTQLERLLALDAESFVVALEQLERHDYLRFEGTRSCSFSHEIVRAAVYDGCRRRGAS
jgi:DNA-binding SARP family transcriptional activator